MRGKGRYIQYVSKSTRITPAYAGKRLLSDVPDNKRWDHPRLCGEKDVLRHGYRYDTGSPPPMRGKGMQEAGDKSEKRITPAYAGKRGKGWQAGNPSQDHPRLCGEKFRRTAYAVVYVGSPPPMRGKAAHLRCRSSRSRITPAYAGKSLSGAGCIRAGKDHPRLCGEKHA